MTHPVRDTSGSHSHSSNAGSGSSDHGHHPDNNCEQGSGGKDFLPHSVVGPMDSHHVPLSSTTWDSETDHILSFFLGGDTGPHGNPHIPDFSTTSTSADVPLNHMTYHPPGMSPSTSNSLGHNPHDHGIFSSGGCGDPLKDFEHDDNDDEGFVVPPPTPVVNFYAPSSSYQITSFHNDAGGGVSIVKKEQPQQQPQPHHHPQHQPLPIPLGLHTVCQGGAPGTSMTSSSSSSSLSSIIPTAGGPLVYQQLHTFPHYHHHQMHSQQQHHGHGHGTDSPQEHISPLSPAALIGHGENLMLPPPPGGTTTANSMSNSLVSQNPSSSSGPPTTDSTANASATTTAAAANASTLDCLADQERHLAWLRDLNAIAKGSTPTSAITTTTTAATTATTTSTIPALHHPGQHPISVAVPQPPPGGGPGGAVSFMSMASHMPAQGNPPTGIHTSTTTATATTMTAPSHHQALHQHPQHPPSATTTLVYFPDPNLVPSSLAIPPKQTTPPPPPQPSAGASASAETAEKRAKRLERNRESARKSRAKKKERLTTLEAHVNVLHGKIEVERRIQINAMVSALKRNRALEYQKLLQQQEQQQPDRQSTAATSNVVFNTGPCSEISRAALDFQYSALKQLVLPRYHKVLLWFTLQNESYFFAAKEAYGVGTANISSSSSTSSNNSNSKLVRSATGKVSSKQIGDEMTNGVAAAGSSKKRVTFQGGKNKKKGDNNDDDNNNFGKANLSPYASDGAKVWPLFCYELSFSVDQEDRFVATNKRLQESPSDLANSRAQVAAAIRTGDRLREAVESLSRRVAEREQNTLNGILSQAQVAAYQQWLSVHRERCKDIMERASQDAVMKPPALPVESSSLDDVCQRLNEVLQISNPDSSFNNNNNYNNNCNTNQTT